MFASEINQPTSMEEDHASSYDILQFPDIPFLDDDDLFLAHFLSQQQQLFVGEDHHHQKSPNISTSVNTTASEGKKKNIRKNGKKDRHSKICTAQGPRDRRMRLSLHIARRFFDLQDMLGFDKASKTIEWLLSHSTSAIQDLTLNSNHNTTYSSASSEVLSEIRDNMVSIGHKEKKFSTSGKEGSFKTRKLRTVPRESRDRARARARERTKEKLFMKGLQISKPTSHSQQNSCFDLQDGNSEETQLEEQPPEIVSDFSDFPWDGKCVNSTMESFSAGNRELENPNSTLACPSSFFMSTPTLPHLKPYTF